jgi:hypothetical protein
VTRFRGRHERETVLHRGSGMKRFALTDMLMTVVWASSAAYFVRIGIDLRQKGFDATDVAVGVGLMAILNVAVCTLVIAIRRRLTSARAVRRDIGDGLRDSERAHRTA